MPTLEQPTNLSFAELFNRSLCEVSVRPLTNCLLKEPI